MRFMMLMIPGVYQSAGGNGKDQTPSAEMVERMMKYNEELARAGLLLALDGLRPPAEAVRISFTGGQPSVTDGPYPETKEVVGGFWMLQAKSREEAVAWARRVPAQEGDLIEVRQVFETEDFPPEARQAAESPVVVAQLEKVKRERKA